MNFKMKFCTIIFAALLSGQASAQLNDDKGTIKLKAADNYNSFTESCNATTARIWSNKKIASIFSDVTKENNGFYITTKKNEIWRIEQSETYPSDDQTEEMRSLAKTALLSGISVNICGTTASSPATAWIIELAL